MGKGGAPAESRLAADSGAFLMNVSTSVLIVFVNKLLFRGYGFVFATTLCSLHFFSAAGFVKAAEVLRFSSWAPLPLYDTLTFATVAAVSISSLNLSLLVNSVGFYQISKLLIIPFVCVAEYVWLGKRFTVPVIMSVLVVVVGVGIVTVSEVSVNALGLVIAAVSVVTSGCQQIMCGVIQRKHSMTSNQLLSNTAPVQGLMLLVVGPFVDQMLTSKWVLSYHLTSAAATVLAASCAIAVLVNVSQFMCLGRFSAVTFQVLGHTKTVLVLLIGCLYFGDEISPRKLFGMSLAVIGMVLYGYLSSLKPAGGPGSSGGTLTAPPSPVKRAIPDYLMEPLVSKDSGDAEVGVELALGRAPAPANGPSQGRSRVESTPGRALI